MKKADRLSTGISGWDEILDGGMLAGSTTLVVGDPGAGKTILSVQWLQQGVEEKERCLFLALLEPAAVVQRHVAGFGWSLQDIRFVDLSGIDRLGKQEQDEYRVFSPSEVEQTSLWESIYQAMEEHRPQRLVIDPLTQLRHLSTDEYQFRRRLQGLLFFLMEQGCTTLLTFESTELERERSVALAVDLVMRMRMDISSDRAIGLRSVEIQKFRGSAFMSGRHPFRFTPQGIVMFPHRIETPGGKPPDTGPLTSGVAGLDALLGGGVETGTATIITGPTGTGKTSLATQFIEHAGKSGMPGLFLTFEESAESIRQRARMLGMGLDEMEAAHTLSLIQVNPLELYPDELLELVRREVRTRNIEVLVLDSLRGYYLAMEQFGTIIAHVQNLVAYLNRKGVTTFLVNEIEHLTGDLQLTELGVSYIADNVLLTRFCESRGKLIKVVACIKKRLGNFESELRELRIGPEGIVVGDRLRQLSGVMTGVPVVTDSPS